MSLISFVVAPKLLSHISGWGTGCNILWQPHLPVNTTEGATGLARFSWNMVVKTRCVHVCDIICQCGLLAETSVGLESFTDV